MLNNSPQLKKKVILSFLLFINVDCGLIVVGSSQVLCVTMEKQLTFFMYFRFGTFSFDTFHWFLYVISVKTTFSLRLLLWFFPQNIQPNLDWKYRNNWTKKLKDVSKKIFHFPYLRENCMEKYKKKFSNQSGYVMLTSIYFTNYRSCCSQVFYGVLNFGEFLETHPWWSTVLVKLLSRPLYRPRLNEGRNMCITWALFKKTLLLVINLKVQSCKLKRQW